MAGSINKRRDKNHPNEGFPYYNETRACGSRFCFSSNDFILIGIFLKCYQRGHLYASLCFLDSLKEVSEYTIKI